MRPDAESNTEIGITRRSARKRPAAHTQKAPNPACPGVIKARPKTCLVELPHQDAYEASKKVTAEGNLGDVEFITCYDVDIKTAKRFSQAERLARYSPVTYYQVAPYVFLDPKHEGRGIKRLHTRGSRLSHAIS